MAEGYVAFVPVLLASDEVEAHLREKSAAARSKPGS